MKKSLIGLFTILFFMTIISNLFAADVAKIGVVFFQKVLVESSAGKLIKKQVEEQNNKNLKILQDEKLEIQALEDELKKMALLPVPVDKNKKTEKEQAYVQRRQKFAQLQKKLTDEMKALNNTLMGQFSKDVNVIVQEIGKKEGYLLILERREAGVFYAPNHIDITDSVTKILNEQTAKEKK